MLCRAQCTQLILVVAVITVVATDAKAQTPREQIEKIITRKSDTYARIYQICSTPFDTSKLIYAEAAAKEVAALATFDTKTLEDKLIQDYAVSSLLENDLNHEGFWLALEDCRYNEVQSRNLVINLLALDVFGKLGGAGVTAYVYVKIIWRLTSKVFSKFPRFAVGMSVGSVLLLAREIYMDYFREDSVAVVAKREINEENVKKMADEFLEANGVNEAEADRLKLVALKIDKINKRLSCIAPESEEYLRLLQRKAELLAL